MRNSSSLFVMTVTLLFLILFTSFIKTTSAQPAVTVTSTISEAPYESQYYYMDIKLSEISLPVGDSIRMIFPPGQCHFGTNDMSLRCYDFQAQFPSIPLQEGDHLIKPLFSYFLLSENSSSPCSYYFTGSTKELIGGGTIRCLVNNKYSSSQTVDAQMTSLAIGTVVYDVTGGSFYAAKSISSFFDVSFGESTMNIQYPITDSNDKSARASLRIDQLIIEYNSNLAPNVKFCFYMKAIFTSEVVSEIDFSTILPYMLPSAYNNFATSDIFSTTSEVPLINQPAKDIGVFFEGVNLCFFTGPNPDQAGGFFSIPISIQAALFASEIYNRDEKDSLFRSLIDPVSQIESVRLHLGRSTGTIFIIDYPLEYLNECLNHFPVEFTDGAKTLDLSANNHKLALNLKNGIVYGGDLYDFTLLTGYTNGNYKDFFSLLNEIGGEFAQQIDPLSLSSIGSGSFTGQKLTAITPNTLSFSQADLELRFARLMDQDGVTPTPVTPSVLTYSLYQKEYTVGHVPLPTFTPLASNSNIEIQVSNTKATMSAQFALSAESRDVFAPTAEFSVDAIFTLRPARFMGELFPQDHPIPVCSFVSAPTTLRIMPHVYSPTGADIHTTAGIRIAGTMPWDSKITMNCAQVIIPGLKTGNADLLALPWVLRLYQHRIYVQNPIDINVLAIYGADWSKQEELTFAPLITVSGPGIENEIQFNFIVDKVVEFIQNIRPERDPQFMQFTSSNLHWATSSPGYTNYLFSRYHNKSVNFDRQFAYPTDPTHLATIQSTSSFQMVPDLSIDGLEISWNYLDISEIYPQLSPLTPLTIEIEFSQSSSHAVRYPNSLTSSGLTPIPYDPSFQWLTNDDGPCFSTLQCDPRNKYSSYESFWQSTAALCFQKRCHSIQSIRFDKLAELQAHIFNPQKRRPDEFTMTGKVTIGGGTKDIIIPGANEFGFGYVAPKFAIQFTPTFAISVNTMINEQHVIIDNDNSEYQSIVGKTYTVQLLSFPSTPTGDIISPTLFRIHWTSFSTTIPAAETLSHLNIPAGTISVGSAANMKFRVTYPDLLTTPTTANPNPMTYLDSAFFTSMASCMAPPAVASNYFNPSLWTNECKNGGQCQSAGCKCVNGYSGSLCDTSPPVPTGCMVAPTTFCGVHGTCNQTTLRCDCSTGWLGSNCAAKEACVALGRNVCSNNGHFLTNPATEQCDDGKCECDNLWIGSKCSICSLSCKNGGRAHKLCTTCGCAAGFAGAQCTCSQQQASFTIAMNNELVAYVHSVRSAFATAQNIADISTIDVSTLDLPQDVISEYSIISDAVVQDLMNSLGFVATTTSTAALTMNSIVNSLPPPSGGDNTDNDTFVSTRFSFTLTYNCNQNEQVNLQQVWNSKYISLLPTKTINIYFTPTRVNPLPENVDITSSPGTINDDYTIDTDDQPNEENSSTHFCFMVVILFSSLAIAFVMV